jgi:hypothetical protein
MNLENSSENKIMAAKIKAVEDFTGRDFVITREFATPRKLVFPAWTWRKRLMQWFGPKSFTMSTAEMDFCPGGSFHHSICSPDGKEMWGKFVYREIIVPENCAGEFESRLNHARGCRRSFLKIAATGGNQIRTVVFGDKVASLRAKILSRAGGGEPAPPK